MKMFEIDADNTGAQEGFTFHKQFESAEEALTAACDLYENGYCAINVYIRDYTFEQYRKKGKQ